MIRPATFLLVALMHSTVWRGSMAQLTYAIKATWMDDPEDRRTVAPNENRWDKRWNMDSAENLGLTFSGKAEFPWVVDIRQERKDEDYFSTGNLIRQDTVFTTCRAIRDLGDFKSRGDTTRVTFAQMYLYEYMNRDNWSQDWAFGGTRNVLDAKKHKDCNVRQTYYDGGILILANGIMPSPPTINTIQLTINYRDGLLADFDLSTMEAQRRICYVASIGRDYANIKNTIVKDFKVKYRVYWEHPDLCRNFKNKMCPNRYLGDGDCNVGGKNPGSEGRELMCFQSRQKVGTVCDHDKGAPLVCDGVVFGLVILGAKPEYCSDVLPLPFWVQKISMFREYFEPPQDEGYGRMSFSASSHNRTRSSADSLLSSSHIRRLLVILIAFTHNQFLS